MDFSKLKEYVISIEDLLKFIDAYMEIEYFIHDYKQLSYDIGFKKELYVGTANKNGIKKMSRLMMYGSTL